MSAAIEPVTCTREHAETLTTAIQETAGNLLALVIEAYERGAWKVLGYDSWTAYVRANVNVQQAKLPAVDRKRAAVMLAEAGMSAREIAPVLGVGHATASRDLAPAVSNETPGPVTAESTAEPEGTAAPKPRRNQLPDQFNQTVGELDRLTRKLSAVVQNDRFVVHRASLRADLLTECRDRISAALDALTEGASA